MIRYDDIRRIIDDAITEELDDQDVNSIRAYYHKRGVDYSDVVRVLMQLRDAAAEDGDDDVLHALNAGFDLGFRIGRAAALG